MTTDTQIQRERPDQPDVVALLDALDTYLASLYPPEANHILDVTALLAPEVRFVVARQLGRAVGCGAVRLMPAEAATGDQPYGEIKRMYVAPEQRGQGLGQQLLQALQSDLRDSGVDQALLETGQAQAEAVALYRKLGFEPCTAFGGYPDNGLSVFYRKAL